MKKLFAEKTIFYEAVTRRKISFNKNYTELQLIFKIWFYFSENRFFLKINLEINVVTRIPIHKIPIKSL